MAKSKKNETEENFSLMELAMSAKARRKLTSQFKDKLRQNVLEVLVKQGNKNPILTQLLNEDRNRK